MYVCTHYRIVLEARARPGRQCCVKGHDRQKRKASESRLTDEVVESMLAEQVSAVEFVAGSQRSEAAWIAVELTSNSERTQLLHAALFWSSVLEPNLRDTPRHAPSCSLAPLSNIFGQPLSVENYYHNSNEKKLENYLKLT